MIDITGIDRKTQIELLLDYLHLKSALWGKQRNAAVEYCTDQTVNVANESYNEIKKIKEKILELIKNQQNGNNKTTDDAPFAGKSA